MPESDEHNRGHKYPFLASEIFSCEINPIIQKFFEAPEPKSSNDEETRDATADKEEKDPETDEDITLEKPKDSDNQENESPAEPDSEQKDTPAEPLTDETQEQPKEEEKAEVKEEAEAPKDEAEKKEEVVEEKSEAVEKKDEINAEPATEDALTHYIEEADKENATVDSTQATTLAEEPVEEVEVDRFDLLHRLFAFLDTRETPLNAVLAGYFSKLVSQLVNNQSKQILPFLFQSQHGDAIFDNLLFHQYQRSISEVLRKLMFVSDHQIDDDLQDAIKEKKQKVTLALIEKMSADLTDEDNLNAQQMIVDLLENKSFFYTVARRATVQKLSEFAFAENGNEYSKNAALSVLAKIADKLNDRSKDDNKDDDDDFKNVNNDEDDMPIKQDSDDENNSAMAALQDEFAELIVKIKSVLENPNVETLHQAMCPEPAHVFGQYRLKALELLHQIVRFRKPAT